MKGVLRKALFERPILRATPGALAESDEQSKTNGTVRAWHERISIPTYEAGPPDPNPFFLEKRVYQGSSGAVYPYPVVEIGLQTRKRRAITTPSFSRTSISRS